jgi:hypothetical protein
MREFDEKLQQRHDATQAATGRCITAFLMASTRQILLMFALLAPARSASIIPARLAEPPSEAAVRTFLSKVQPLPVVPGKQLTFEQVLKADGLSYYSKRLDTEDAKVLAYVVCVSTVLVKLYIGANSIGDAGAAALAEALKTNRMVKELSLNENSIGDVGAAALGEALLVNPVISVVSLAGNPSIGDKGAAASPLRLQHRRSGSHGYCRGATCERSAYAPHHRRQPHRKRWRDRLGEGTARQYWAHHAPHLREQDQPTSQERASECGGTRAS